MEFFYVIVIVLSSMWLFVAELLISGLEGTRSEAEMKREWPGKICLPFNRHAGLLSDLFLITPFWIWFAIIYLPDIRMGAYGIAACGGLLVSIPLHLFWKKGSKDVYDPCYQEGITSLVGKIHFGYMIQHFALVFLFYFFAHPTRTEVALVTLLLAVHVTLGMFQPEWFVQQRMGRARIRCGVWIGYFAVIGVLLMIARYTWLHNSRY